MKIFTDKFLIIFILLQGLVISSVINAQSAELKTYPLLNSIYEINKDSHDTCLVIAFVNNLYHCPPCPPGATCKPCIGNHIMIADTLNAKKQFRVFVDEPDKFLVGEKCKLLIRLYKYISQQEVYEGKLIAQ